MPPASMPSARPPPAAAAAARNLRRDRLVMVVVMACLPSALLLVAGREMDRLPDALIGAAPTDVGHGGVDVGIGGLGLALQQGGGGHDLAGLAVAALRNLQLQPGLLHGATAGVGETFDSDDLVGWLDVLHLHQAGALH